ncbi:MAG: 2-amino-4-hydroxy-6-hydroxymethyldihydropteridine diphosphokinase, partial [Pseudomonadota bacterium]
EALLKTLHDVEAAFGRERRERWSARTCDLDLIAFGDDVAPDEATVRLWMDMGPEAAGATCGPDRLILPHPRAEERAFVLAPIAEIAPEWRHPLTGRTAAEALAALPAADRESLRVLDERT